MLARVRKFLAKPSAARFAITEAVVTLAAAQLLVWTTPYRWWSRLLGDVRSRHEAPASSRPAADDAVLSLIERSIGTAARHLPWEVVCLPQAMAAKWMLARRGIPSTMFLGIRRSACEDTTPRELHAWLAVGERTITGGGVADQFSVIAQYGSRQKRSGDP